MISDQHQRLAALNQDRLAPALPDARWREALDREHELRLLEGELVETERAAVADRAAQAPYDPRGFVAWFEALEANGPGQHDPLFPWLARTASFEQVRWFLCQEVAGEAGFDDLVALAQLRLPAQPKLEMARNYWDEMGRGVERGMHGPMLGRLADALAIDELATTVPVVWESLALGNLMLAMAANRRYAYHAIGALGVIELTAPGRATLVNEALRRLGVAARSRQYFALHATLDVKHSEAWCREVLAPIVAAEPDAAAAIAEGALIRLEAGRRCFVRYRAELGVDRSAGAAQMEQRAIPQRERSLARH